MIRTVRTLLTAFGLAISLSSSAPADGPFRFYSVTPCRIVDTRDPIGPNGGPALGHGEVRAFPAHGLLARPCGIPPDARAVSLNVCVFNPSSAGHLIMFATGDPVPAISTINFEASVAARANGAVVSLGSDASYQVSVQAGLAGLGNSVNVSLDVTGYYR
jgi:hypothetical protein